MEVVEKVRGGHACPEFVLTEAEESRLQMPWRKGIIVKLLGRKIGYKALENILKQMWVRNGVINIVDVGNDYFLVTFTNMEDHYRALIDGPWMIYDNYLVVREWSPNFHPFGEVIEKVAVWVRFSGLPIEYYDKKMLHFIGNRIGRTVKVDRTTTTQTRGKYARLCVEVDLTKPLLAMFQIKDRYYKVEYEGLHMLCLACGTFGHYKEGCVVKDNNNEWNGEQQADSNSDKGGVADTAVKEGPWTIVQKQRRPKKKVENSRHEETRANGGERNMGSRFALLGNNIPLLEEDDNVVTNEETLIANVDKSQHGNMHKNQHVKDTRLGTKKVTQSLHVLQKGDQYIENLKRSSDAISGPNAQTRIQARKIGHGIHMENNFDVALMEEDTNKVTLHNTREDYNRVTHGPEETKDMNSTKNLSHPHVGPNHAPRPPDIVT
jgi:hypothetical protein